MTPAATFSARRLRMKNMTPAPDKPANEWRDMVSDPAPKDGTLIDLCWMENGKPQEIFPGMRWNHFINNPLVQSEKGIWALHGKGGEVLCTWTEKNEGRPTHWRLPLSPAATGAQAMTDAPPGTRQIHDPFLNKTVKISNKLTDRLRGKYANGPTLPNGEPEFGWHQFPVPTIHKEAADEIERLQSLVESLCDDNERLIRKLPPPPPERGK